MNEAMRDMEAAMNEASECRRRASEMRQAGFASYAAHLLENAKGAEAWLAKAGRAYPRRCDSRGKPVTA